MVRKISWLLFCLGCGAALHAQQSPGDLHFPFSVGDGGRPASSNPGESAVLGGSWRYVRGVSGDALRFDGYTTRMTIRAPQTHPIGPNGFTVAAWVALNTYPWNWVPVVDQELDRQEGYSLGIDAMGHFALGASVNGHWHELVSKQTLPLKQWAEIAGTYQTIGQQGKLTLFLNGAPIAAMDVHGVFTPARTDILIGRVRQPTLPFPEAVVKPQYPIWYSLDGILDDLTIDGHSTSAEQMAAAFASVSVPQGDVLPWPKMPSGPPGPGRFGAVYATLHYQDTWDSLRRIGPDSDVVVRFDESPIRLVFWQGTNYIPAWVTENDKWYSDEFVETWDSGCPLGGDCEPMSDKQSRYSRVSIQESNDARVVVHWRYADVEVEKYQGAWADPDTGWFHWIDEYWTVYPDGIAIRKQVLHEGNASLPHEWQETVVLHQPGMRPEDDINWDAITLENMDGETKTYRWRPKTSGEFSPATGPDRVTGPNHPNIQIVNLKSQWKPFQITTGQDAAADIYGNEDTYSAFLCWNHWPVAQIASSDRACVTDDRASHSSLSHLYWKIYSSEPDSETKILMDGLTTRDAADLLPLARSWISPPEVQVHGNGFRSEGYDPAQRAFVIAKSGAAASPVTLLFAATRQSPLFNPAIVIQNWGDGDARLSVDGKPVPRGRDLRTGHIERLDGTDLVIWMQRQSAQTMRLEVSPAR